MYPRFCELNKSSVNGNDWFTSNCSNAPNENANTEGTNIDFFHFPKVGMDRSKWYDKRRPKTTKTKIDIASWILKL